MLDQHKKNGAGEVQDLAFPEPLLLSGWEARRYR